MIGRYDDSLADINHVLDLEPRHFGALSGLGMIKQQQGDKKAALAAFRDALAVNPQLEGAKQAVEELAADEEAI
jgi:tetratricopeptide (TPR) repeat protein